MASSLTAILLSLTTLLSGLTAQLGSLQVPPLGQLAQVASSQKSVLSPSDFTYQGYYDLSINGQDTSYMRSLTYRYVNGQLRFLTMGHGGILYEFAPPSSYGSKVNGYTATWNIGSVSSDFTGIWWDEAAQRLWVTSTVDYGSSGTYYPTRISTLTLGSNGSISNVKTISLEGIGSKRVYGGALALPSWFQSQYGCGPYAVGFGGYTSLLEQTTKASLGPELICIPDPANYSNGATIPSGSFKVLLDTVGSRGYRATFPINYLDGGDARQNPPTRPTVPPLSTAQWLSPNSAGYGWMTWGDSYYNTGMWIETSSKHGYVAVAALCKGACWYQSSQMEYDGRTQELHIWDPNILNNGKLTRPTSMTELNLPRGNSLVIGGNVPSGNISGAVYDPVSGNMYLVGYPLGPDVYTGRLYVYKVASGGGASVPTTPTTPTSPTATPTNAVLSSWSAWSDTSGWSACANGTQTKTQQRTRTVVTAATNGGTTGALSETQTVSQSCTTSTTTTSGASATPKNPTGYTYCVDEGSSCNFSGTKSVAYGANGVFVYKDVTNGTACSNSVFGGDPIANVGKFCSTKDVSVSTPVDAVLSAWSSWSELTPWSTCSAGLQSRTETRTRTVVTPASNGGTTGALSETRTATQSCTIVLTPVNAVVSSWSAWSDTSGWSACANGTQTKTQQRTRTVVTAATNGGTTPVLSETQTISQSCTTSTPTTEIAKFSAGDGVQTSAALNVRSTASIDGSVLGTQSTGSTGKVADGPEYQNGIKWWKIDYISSPDGWSAEDYLVKSTTTTNPTEPTESTGQKLTQDLRLGSRGSQVVILQNFFIKKGYLKSGLNTGYFGYSTYTAVQKYQRANGISATGFVGIQTRTKINAEL